MRTHKGVKHLIIGIILMEDDVELTAERIIEALTEEKNLIIPHNE